MKQDIEVLPWDAVKTSKKKEGLRIIVELLLEHPGSTLANNFWRHLYIHLKVPVVVDAVHSGESNAYDSEYRSSKARTAMCKVKLCALTYVLAHDRGACPISDLGMPARKQVAVWRLLAVETDV